MSSKNTSWLRYSLATLHTNEFGAASQRAKVWGYSFVDPSWVKFGPTSPSFFSVQNAIESILINTKINFQEDVVEIYSCHLFEISRSLLR